MSRSSVSIQSLSGTVDETVARPRAAYHRLLDEIDAVRADALIPVNIDVAGAITTTRGALPEIQQHAEDLARLPRFNVRAFDRLEDYALALQHAHVVYLAAAAPPEEVGEIVQQATDARETLLADLQPLGKRGIVPPNRLAELERTPGHRGVALDVGRLVEILREYWPALAGKTALTLEQLAAFEKLSDRLVAAVGLREQAPAAIGPATERRQRAFSLLVRAYDEVRRGVTFLRYHEGDADEIMPSLYAARAVGRRKPEPAQATPASPPTQGVPAHPVAGTATTAEPVVKPGMPGSSPFSN